MPTYEQLYHLNLSNLSASVSRWEETANKFKTLQTSFADKVERPFKQANWTQPVFTAANAQANVNRARQEYQDAQTEAKGIAGVLKTLHEELKQAQTDLRDLADVEAKKQDLYVSPTGTVTPRHDLSQDQATIHDPDGQTAIREQQKKCDAFAARIKTILQRAADADETACWALRRDAGSQGDFNASKVVTSLDDADATQAADLLRKGDKLTDSELAELNQLMKENEGDSEFATRFYQQLGQEKALQMYGQLAPQSADASDERQALLREMQRGMGDTLAAATDPDNEWHLSQQWADDLRKLGTQHIQLHDTDMREGPYGYQLLGGILRSGNYDSTFLTPIAEHVTQLHVADPYFFANTKYDIGDPELGFNPSGKNGSGYDPMNSVLEALGHSPEAATDYFSRPMTAYAEDGSLAGDGNHQLYKIDGAENYLDYLVNKDYESFPDITGHDLDAAKTSMNAFPDSLGHALEAATTGRPWDGNPNADSVSHTDAQAHLAQLVVNKFGGQGGPELLNGTDGAPYEAARDSLGNIAAEYMGDVQRAVSGRDDLPVSGAAAGLEAATTEPFLAAVGQDPDAYAAITGSQQAYTSGIVDNVINGGSSSSMDDAERMKLAIAPGSIVAGIMTEARADAVFDTHRASDEDFNKSAETASKWVGRGLGMATGAIRVPVVGDVTGWVVEDIQSSVMESIKRDTTTEARYEAGLEYTSGRESAQFAAAAAVDRAAVDSQLNADTIRDLRNAAIMQAGTSHSEGSRWEDARHG